MNEEPKLYESKPYESKPYECERYPCLFVILLFVLPMVNLGLCIWLVKELNEIARMLKP